MTRLNAGRWDATVRSALEALIDAHGQDAPGYQPATPPIAVFDWDNTCITGDIGEAVLRRLDADGRPGAWAEYERLCHDRGDAIGYRYCAEVVGGGDPMALRLWISDVIDDCLATGEIKVRPEMRELFWALQVAGWQPWVVSASAEPLVSVFAQRYGVPGHRVIGMVLGRDPAGCLLQEVVGPVTYRGGKVDAIDQRIGRRPTLAGGDATTDLEMLGSASHALLFDRGNTKLTRIAAGAGWWLQPAWT